MDPKARGRRWVMEWVSRRKPRKVCFARPGKYAWETASGKGCPVQERAKFVMYRSEKCTTSLNSLARRQWASAGEVVIVGEG